MTAIASAALSVPAKLKAHAEKKAQGDWRPGCGGTEEPFYTRSGKRLLYCYQPSTGRHAYLDLGSDIILSDSEAREALATY